jgi:lipid-A-disaccharide synthase-like uncharacterized protein
MNAHIIWLIIGFVGQTFFSARFLVQWLYSEWHKHSLIPTAFWYFSIAGGLVLLTYAIHQRDPVFIIGQLTGLFVYARNLYFITRGSTKARDELRSA